MAKKKRPRRCQHEHIRIHVPTEQMHECKECELRRYVREDWLREGRKLGFSFIAWARDGWGRPPGKCQWPEVCGKRVPVPGLYYAKCDDCGMVGDTSSSQFGAAKAFALKVKKR